MNKVFFRVGYPLLFSQQKYSLPGQSCILDSDPVHSVPPFAGLGLSHDFKHNCVSIALSSGDPHSLGVHTSSDQPPFTEKKPGTILLTWDYMKSDEKLVDHKKEPFRL